MDRYFDYELRIFFISVQNSSRIYTDDFVIHGFFVFGNGLVLLDINGKWILILY
ncbi:hypothetical protein KAS08_04415 [Candidatus Pacearchaeota archaeon]|nr:hypothetical protein [Candidatus Pacearchaeota archaeon]